MKSGFSQLALSVIFEEDSWLLCLVQRLVVNLRVVEPLRLYSSVGRFGRQLATALTETRLEHCEIVGGSVLEQPLRLSERV